MPQQVFINLPVKDLNRSVEFFTKLGYTFNAQFTNEHATSMVISDTIYVMLLTENFFKGFTTKTIANAKETTEAIICLSAESREAVDDLIGKAVAAGATATTKQDHGWMYQHGYEDLDGHLWEIAFMDISALPQQ